jgi:hypothetical protein
MSGEIMASTDRQIRLAGVYATRWRYRQPPKPRNRRDRAIAVDTSPAPPKISFADTWLADFEVAFSDQLPRLPKLIAEGQDVTNRFAFRRAPTALTIAKAEVFLFALPSDQVVASLLLECGYDGSLSDAVVLDELDRLLDDFTEDAFTIMDTPNLVEFLRTMAPVEVENFTDPYEVSRTELGRFGKFLVKLRIGGQPMPDIRKKELDPQLSERHEVVFLAERTPLPESAIERLLYREKARYQKEFCRREDLKELAESLEDDRVVRHGIVTTRSSIIHGHAPLLEASVLLSTVQAVGTLARFRDIWDRTYDLVRAFRNDKQRTEIGTQTRDDLEDLVDQLGNLEFDLTFSVEFPLMRIESFHDALSEVLDVKQQAQRLSEMFFQLSGSVKSEITAIDIRDSRESEVRHSRNDLASQWLAAVGVPVGALLAFFGINATQVNDDWSMLAWTHYEWAYLSAFLLGLLPVVVLRLSKRQAYRRLEEAKKQRAEKARLDQRASATAYQHSRLPHQRPSADNAGTPVGPR